MLESLGLAPELAQDLREIQVGGREAGIESDRLLEECFGRQLDERYFESKSPYRVYLAESYRATAILTMEQGIPYLDKFAVTNEAQGEGIGGSIWQRFRRENTKIFWRSRATNGVNTW